MADINFTVTFSPGANGTFSGGGQSVQTIPSGGAAAAPGVVANTGWVHTGWDSDLSPVTANLAITATYMEDRHLVTFSPGDNGTFTGGGGAIQQLVLYGESAVAPGVAANDGWAHTGWAPGFTNVTSDISSVAQYSKTGFLVTFNIGAHGTHSGGGALVQMVPAGQGATAPGVTPNTGYTFTGWDADFSHVLADMTVTASYSPLPLTIIFNPTTFGTITSGSAVQNILAGESVTAPGITAKPGWVFIGWNKSLENLVESTTITAQYIQDTSGPIACSFPCNCGCMTMQVHGSTEVLLNGAVYKPGTCASSPEGFCCNGPLSPHLNDKMAKESGIAALIGEGGDAGRKCNCVYTGNFDLYEDGDLSKDQLSFGITIYVFDSGIVYTKVEGNSYTFIGYSTVGVTCIVKCYDRVEDELDENEFGLPLITYPEVLTDVAYLTGTLSAAAQNNFDLQLTFLTPEDQQACRDVCVVSYLANAAGHPIMSTNRGGRCPTFTPSPRLAFDTRLAEGWHCLAYSALMPDGVTYKKDCNGNNQEPLYELIVYKDDGFDWNDQPCEADCCSVLVTVNREFVEPGLWWRPIEASGWVESAAQECAKAVKDGTLVWKMYNPADCSTWYQAIPQDVPQYDFITGLPNPEWPWPKFKLEAPCGAKCKFYMPGIDEELTDLEAYAGNRLPGTELTGYMVIKSEELDIPNILSAGVPEDGKQLCAKARGQKICGEASTRAPGVLFSIFACVDCVECYELDGVTPKPGLTSYTELVYGEDYHDVVNVARARIAELHASETALVIPYAPCYLVDTERVTPCSWGIQYGSVETSVNYPGHWKAMIVMCVTCGQGEMCEANAKTYFYGHTPVMDSVPRIISPDGTLGYCRDFDMAAAMVSGWVAYADEMYTQDCFGWLSAELSTVEPWNHLYEDGAWIYDRYLTTGAACYPGLLTARPHRKERYPLGPVNIANPTAPTSAVRLICTWNNTDQAWRWSGHYSECRWCDPLCSTACGAYEGNPCLRGMGYWPYTDMGMAYSTLIGDLTTSMPAGCNSAKMTELIDLVGNRGWALPYWDDAWSRKAYIVKCDPRLLSTGLHPHLAGCVVEYCMDTCNILPPAGPYPQQPDFQRQGYWGNACACRGSAYTHWTGGADIQIGHLLAAYEEAIDNCLGNPMYIMTNIAWEPCEDCSKGCINTLVSTDPAHYVRSFFESYYPSGQTTEQPGDNEYWRYISINPISPFPWNKQIIGYAMAETNYYEYIDPNTGMWVVGYDSSNVMVDSVGGYVCCVNPAWRQPESGALPCS